MTPLPALLLLALSPASAELKNQAGCTNAQWGAVQAAIPEARKRVEAALQAMRELPQARGEQAEKKRDQLMSFGRKLFGSGFNLPDVTGILGLMKDELDSPDPHCAAAADPNCGNRAGYVRSDQKSIYLCPKFFSPGKKGVAADPDSVEQRVRTMVHEAAHRAHPDIAEQGGESYCIVFDCEGSCGDKGAHVADNWSHFAHCASGQKPDEGDVITAAPKR